MDVFLAQMVGFAVIVWVIVKFVVPPARKLMKDQQDQVREQILESEAAAARLAESQQAQQAAIEKAKAEAVTIRERAEADAKRIQQDLRDQSEVESVRIRQHGVDQVALQRQQTVRQLEADLGSAAATEADRRVREHLAGDAEKSASVDRFLDELEAMAGSMDDAPINSGQGS